MAKFFTMIALLVTCGLLADSSALPRVPRKLHPEKIIGGEAATQGQLPYQIALRRSGSHICGGALALINGTQVVITAASCVDDGTPTTYEALAGDLKRGDSSGLEQVRKVSRAIVHEDYGGWVDMSNDIAVLLLASPFELNENVGPIALPTQDQQATGDVIVSGWGTTTSNGGSLADHLHFVQLPIVDDARCQQAYPSEVIRENMLCTGLLQVGGKDSCLGDTGGPVRSVGGNYLAGVVSWRYGGCADPRYPSVNTEVSFFINWLNKAIDLNYSST